MRRRVPFYILWLMLMSIWFIFAVHLGIWELYQSYWSVILTMVIGSFIAGATSEGGGAVAFPVFTLILGFTPMLARDFSLFIQTAGMGMASLMIYRQQSPVASPVLVPVTLGGIVGVYLGMYHIAPQVQAATVKMFFETFFHLFVNGFINFNGIIFYQKFSCFKIAFRFNTLYLF